MKYYDLDENGRIEGSYAVEQPGRVLYFLEEPIIPFPMRDGVPGENWITDPIAEAAAQAVADFENTKAEAILDLLPSRQQVINFFADLHTAINTTKTNIQDMPAGAAKIAIASLGGVVESMETVLEKLVQLEYLIVKSSLD